MKATQPQSRRLATLLASALALAATAAPAVDIAVTTDPAGPVEVGQELTVRLGVSGWEAGDPEVDAIAFNVDFDTALFEFVSGTGETLDNGSEFLALPSQGASYNLGNDSSESLAGFGRYIFGATDTADPASGSLGPDGPLGSFRLRAIAAGTGTISAVATDPNMIFSDTAYYGIAPTGGVNLGAADVVVVSPGITYALWAAAIPFANQNDAKPDADPDKDGRKNTLEYFLDANPLRADPDRSPTAGSIEIAGRTYTTLTYERPAGALARSDAEDVGERSIDLVVWRSGDVVVEKVDSIDPATGREIVVLRSTHPIGSFDGEFLRLLVTLK